MTNFFKQEHWKTILISFFNNFFAGMMILILIALQLSFSKDLKVPVTETALLISVSSFGTLLTMYFSGSLSDKTGRKNLILVGLLVYVVYLLGFILNYNLNVLMIFSIFAGIANGLIDSPGKSLIFDSVKGNKGPYLSVNQVFFSAGSVFSTILASLFAKEGWSWRYIYWLYLFITVIYFLVILFSKFPPVTKVERVEKVKTDLTTNRSQKFVMSLLLVCMLLFAMIQSIITTWIPDFALTIKNFTESVSVSLLTYYQVGGVLGAIIIGQLMKKIHTTNFMILSPIIAFISLLSFLYFSSSNVLLILVLTIGFSIAIYYAYCINMGGLIYPNNTGASSGAVGTMFMLGQTITILLSSRIVKQYGLETLFILCVSLIVVLTIMSIYFKKEYFQYIKK